MVVSFEINYEASKIPLPPLLNRVADIESSDDLLDLNACYVRIRDEGNAADPLIRFPSVTYAADRNSNVAMITLRATESGL